MRILTFSWRYYPKSVTMIVTTKPNRGSKMGDKNPKNKAKDQKRKEDIKTDAAAKAKAAVDAKAAAGAKTKK